MTDDEKLPLEDDEGAEEQSKPQADPFSEYINENLSLADVPSNDDGKPPADDITPLNKTKPLSPAPRHPFGSDKDDPDEDDSLSKPPYGLLGPPNVSRFGLPRPPRPLSSSDSKDEGAKPASSPFGSRFTPPPAPGSSSSGSSAGWPTYSGSRSGSGNTPPGSFGSRFGASSSTPPNRPESRFSPPEKPLDSLRRSAWRALLDDLSDLIDKEARAIIAVLVALLILLLNLLYIDNLRLTIATQEGQITELRQQLEKANSRLESLRSE
ncbi:MAG: hypothetical protein NZ750_08875 [Anaerolineae bacterium]|nr:hypothetical protein [Anaerolineae bacterium]MDW8171730.1 hypothetical protein [Anaerolineae bacterium]